VIGWIALVLASAASTADPPTATTQGDWDRALAEVRATLGLPDGDVTWSAGTLTLAVADRKVALTGLPEPETHAARVEQLYLAVARLGAAAPPALPAQLLGPPAPPVHAAVARRPRPAPDPPPVPRTELLPAHVVVWDPPLPPPRLERIEAPPVREARTAFGALVGWSGRAPEAAVDVRRGDRLRIAARAGVARQVLTGDPVDALLTGPASLVRADATARVEAVAPVAVRGPGEGGLLAGVHAGGSLRWYRALYRPAGFGGVPIAGGSIGAEWGAPNVVARAELSYERDLREVVLNRGRSSATLPADRVDFVVGVAVRP
jgi:hypothetical protein